MQGGRSAADHQCDRGADIGVQHRDRADAVDPHHGGGGVADHAARTSRVGRGDDGSEVSDMDLSAEHGVRHRPADRRRGDVVEEGRQHEYHHEQHERALPVARQEPGQQRRHLAVLEMLRQQRETEQQAQAIGEDDPLMGQVGEQARDAVARLEPGEGSLYRVMTASPTSVTPSSVSANRMKSSGTPSTAGAAACIPYPFAVEEHLPTRTKVSLAKLGLPAGRRSGAGADPVLTTDRNGAPAAPP